MTVMSERQRVDPALGDARRAVPDTTLTTTCEGRHRAYRAMAEALRADPTLPAAVRGIRFFDAAAVVTAPNGVGLLLGRSEGDAAPFFRRLVGGACIAPLDAIGARLFDCNVALYRRLVCEWRELRSPLTARAPLLTPASFDAATVVFEQRIVGDHLVRHPPSAAARAAIDRWLRMAASPLLARAARLDDDLAAAVREARRAGNGGFMAIESRVAVGQALVRRLQGDAVVPR